jgi:UDP-glucose 4-epimerase
MNAIDIKTAVIGLGYVGLPLARLFAAKYPVVAMTGKETGKRSVIKYEPFQITDLTETRADNTKARDALGWMPKIDFAAGLRNSAERYRENENWLRGICL